MSGCGNRAGGLTYRARLTLSYVAVSLTMGALLILVSYAFMRFFPRDINIELPEQDRVIARLPADPELLDRMLATSFAVLIVVTAVSGCVGWFLAGRVIKPLARMRDAAQDISAGHLDKRLEVPGADDEIAHLAATFNRTFDSLEAMLAAQRRFSAAASHELLTPIATMQTMLDVELMDEQDPLRRTFLTQLREVNAANARTVEALLELARAESGVVELARVDLAGVVREALDQATPAAQERGLAVTAQVDDACVWGHADLLRRVVGNLVRNAVRHNVSGGFISVELAGCVLTVANSGPVMGDVAKLTEPFFRGSGPVAAPRSPAERGHGLGLSIVAAAVEVLGGELELEARSEGGLTARVRLAPA